jgi:hypothetical protein
MPRFFIVIRLLVKFAALNLCLTQPILAETAQNKCTLQKFILDDLVNASQGPRPNGIINSRGAAGSNADFEDGKRSEIHIDEQRIVGDWVQAGRVRNRPDWARRGWDAVAWGLSQKRQDGTFGGKDSVHGGTMFLEAALRSYRLDQWMGILSEGQSLRDGLLLATWSLASRDPERDSEFVRSSPLTHRFWIKAALFGSAASVFNEPHFNWLAEWNAKRGIAAQWPNGVNPEKSGFDVGYQATGLLYMARYLATCPSPEIELAVKRSMRLGLEWLSSRVKEGGVIDAEGSTRIGVERTRRGSVKGIPYGIVADAFASGAYFLRDKKYAEVSIAIVQSSQFTNYFSKKN